MNLISDAVANGYYWTNAHAIGKARACILHNGGGVLGVGKLLLTFYYYLMGSGMMDGREDSTWKKV